MGIFGDKPKQLPKTSENKKQPEMVSPQMVESLKICHWEVRYDQGTAKIEYKKPPRGHRGLREEGFFSYMLKPKEEHASYPDDGWILNVTVNVTLKGNLTSGGAEVGFFLNYNLLGTASCDEWGKVSLCKRFHHKEQLIPKNGDKLTVRIKGMAIEDEVILTLDGNRNGKMA